MSLTNLFLYYQCCQSGILSALISISRVIKNHRGPDLKRREAGGNHHPIFGIELET